MTKRAFLDKLQEKIISRRFLAWVVACFMLGFGKLDGEGWGLLTMVFIGGEVAEKYINYFKK